MSERQSASESNENNNSNSVTRRPNRLMLS